MAGKVSFYNKRFDTAITIITTIIMMAIIINLLCALDVIWICITKQR